MDDIKGDTILLTVFLRHDQSQPLEEFQTKLDERGWWDNFPPDGVEVVSWNVVMGVGQIATLRLPPSRIQAVNVALEKYAWGVFRTEVYASYDFEVVRARLAQESRDRQSKKAGAAGSDSAGSDASGSRGQINSGAGGGDHPRLPHNGLYMEQFQARIEEPTSYEMTLGSALEEIFGQGMHDLPEIVAALNAQGLKTPEGAPWTEENFANSMERLGA